MKRFVVVNGSQSHHCCFEYTVVDTQKPLIVCGEHYKNRYESVCECFEKENADIVCAALNEVSV